MFVGILQVDLSLNKPRTLKEKRQVVKPLLERLRGSFNVSAAEVADQDLYQRAGLGISTVGNAPDHVRGRLQQVLNHLQSHPSVRVLDHQLEVL